ncbi:MAG: Crp/Fnr family transcriptional regulator [Bacteroidales bacterium]|nr:Crp/Fnr family transcriptional regulator [Bacteroidales bacterium]
MRLINKIDCESCPLKCDIFLTAKEMNIQSKLETIHTSYKKREVICRQNTFVSHAIIIVEGNAKMYIDGIYNRNIILNILLPSNYIGLLSVFGSPNYNYNVAALNDCHTCQVDIEIIRTLYYGNHNFLMKLNHAFGITVSTIMQKLISLNQKQIRGKVAESLLYLSQLYDASRFVLTITRKELGELSAISEENAVRVLTEFKNENIIDMKGKEIYLRNIKLLKKISEIG